MFGYEHLQDLQKTIKYRIKYVEGYIQHNGLIDSKKKYLGLDVPELLAFLEKFGRFMELSHNLLHNVGHHLKDASKVVAKDKQRKTFIEDYDNLLRKIENTKDQCIRTMGHFNDINNPVIFDSDRRNSDEKHLIVLSALQELKKLDVMLDELNTLISSEYIEVRKFLRYISHLQNLFRQVAKDLIQFDKVLEELGCDTRKGIGSDVNIREYLR